ncbi:ribosome biogenesis GTPase [Lutibacter oricola]|uniref:Small ribosomal subunit biogenesis GTPase RsgA n=1 Tax=Lutibacter oricola TaxID=762486 RepID=A0A1H3BKX2_9FLAO|nr:ribosome small subunit-dependent GTPase A [Lutibacter oricola]SDX42620.1 ribosome biogenesis GTPase [Lutibacter oricola]
MTLNDLGFNKQLDNYRIEQGLDSFEVARVISEHKDRYTVKTAANEFDAELIGNLRFSAESKHDLPAVGDWVAISEYDENKALIHSVYPRTSILERKAIGKLGETQIIATNIDVGIIVLAVNRDFNINRIERYLTICNSSKIEPIILISKIDLIDASELKILLNEIKKRIKNISIIAISNQSQIGIDIIKQKLTKGKTYCLLGSSGVGKSTLINSLMGKNIMITKEISDSIDRGKHATTHRELIVSENGILIDNPGMREVGITDNSEALEITFDEITNLALNCKFNDCSHTNEKGCAIIEALENDELDNDSYLNFQKMERERNFFDSNQEERKKKDKDLGKLIKRVVKQRKKHKF